MGSPSPSLSHLLSNPPAQDSSSSLPAAHSEPVSPSPSSPPEDLDGSIAPNDLTIFDNRHSAIGNQQYIEGRATTTTITHDIPQLSLPPSSWNHSDPLLPTRPELPSPETPGLVPSPLSETTSATPLQERLTPLRTPDLEVPTPDTPDTVISAESIPPLPSPPPQGITATGSPVHRGPSGPPPQYKHAVILALAAKRHIDDKRKKMVTLFKNNGIKEKYWVAKAGFKLKENVFVSSDEQEIVISFLGNLSKRKGEELALGLQPILTDYPVVLQCNTGKGWEVGSPHSGEERAQVSDEKIFLPWVEDAAENGELSAGPITAGVGSEVVFSASAAPDSNDLSIEWSMGLDFTVNKSDDSPTSHIVTFSKLYYRGPTTYFLEQADISIICNQTCNWPSTLPDPKGRLNLAQTFTTQRSKKNTKQRAVSIQGEASSSPKVTAGYTRTNGSETTEAEELRWNPIQIKHKERPTSMTIQYFSGHSEVDATDLTVLGEALPIVVLRPKPSVTPVETIGVRMFSLWKHQEVREAEKLSFLARTKEALRPGHSGGAKAAVTGSLHQEFTNIVHCIELPVSTTFVGHAGDNVASAKRFV